MHQDRDARGREGDQADREQQDRAPVGVEVDQAGLERGGVQQRRQQPEEHHLRLQLHVRDERQVGADHPHDDQDEGEGRSSLEQRPATAMTTVTIPTSPSAISTRAIFTHGSTEPRRGLGGAGSSGPRPAADLVTT